jgi:tetratricopeptide (TPR) repeat protein
MSRSIWLITTALIGTSVVLVQPAIAAKSAAEVQAIARGVTVEIRLKQDESVGSGIIIAHQGDLYTIATNRHVVCGAKGRDQVPAGETYELGLADGQKYRVKAASVKLIGTDLDLAIVQFRSDRKYPVASIGNTSLLKAADVVYTAGFPLEQPGFSFNQGSAIAVVDRRITGDRGGYSIIYNAFTLPGMSGGGVFDRNGQLVAIHGQGERYGKNTDLDSMSRVDNKIGLNRGIPVRWLVQSLANTGINLGGTTSTHRAEKEQSPGSADEYFIAGFNKFVEPGNDVMAGKLAAIQELSKAIEIKPRYMFAYFIRAIVYYQLQKFQQSLSDYDQAIALSPKDSSAYNNRGALKYTKLNDFQGALSDYSQAIAFNPKYAEAYNNRANLKMDKLDDPQGAMSDYKQAIALNPKYADAYNNRGNLKYTRLNDVQGALSDYNQAIALSPKYAEAYYNRANLKYTKLNDLQGALSDYNQAIALSPKYAEAYNNRADLKYNKLKDKAGATQDFRRAAQLFRAQGQTQNLQRAIANLKELGATKFT